MRKFCLSMIVISALVVPFFSFAQEGSRGKYGQDPITVLNSIAQGANDEYRIQQTALDNVADNGSYGSQYKVSNTLDWLKNNITPYLQWMVYIGLAAAVILLIYNGFLMVTNAIHKEGDIEKIKKRFIYILVGVLLLTGFYFIIKLTVSIINSIFGGYDGGTGF